MQRVKIKIKIFYEIHPNAAKVWIVKAVIYTFFYLSERKEWCAVHNRSLSDAACKTGAIKMERALLSLLLGTISCINATNGSENARAGNMNYFDAVIKTSREKERDAPRAAKREGDSNAK